MEAAALGLRVDGIGNIDAATSSLDRFRSSGDAASRSADDLAKDSVKSSRALADAAREGDRAASSMSRLSGAAKAAGAALVAALSVRQLQTYADTWSDLTSRIQVSIGPQQSAADVMERISDIARMTYSDLESTAESFARNSVTLRALGRSTNEMLNYTEALNNALVVSGAKADRAEMVQNSLAKAMAEGTLRGEELNNVLNSGSRIAELLAEELGVNITELRGVAAQGKITGDVIYSSLVGNMELLAEQAESMPATIGDAFTLMRNAVLQSVGVYDQQNGLSEALAENLVDISDAIRDTDWSPYIDGIVTAAKVTGTFAIAIYAIPALQGAWTIALAAKAAALKLFTAQVVTATGALGLLQKSLLVVAAAFAGVQIGTYLRNEFEIVERAGIALMGGLHTMTIRIGGFFEVMGQNIKFAVMNPLDAIRGAIADMLEWVSGLGQSALNFLGFEGLAEGIKTEFAGIRGATAAEHKATLDQIRAETANQIGMVNDIYASMFADVGKGASEAASSLDLINDATETVTNTVTELTDAQKALTTAFEQMLSDYHRQITLGTEASEVEQLLYEVQHGRLKGLLPAQQEMLEGMARELDMRAKLRQIEEDQQEINRERDSIARDLMAEEDKILDSYKRRRDMVLAATFENEQARTELLMKLERERDEQLLEVSGSYWERWLQGAEENLTSFNEIAGNVVEGFSTRFGDAFESMIFDAQSLGDAVQGMAEGMLRAVVNAIGQMIAQELAYQAILALRGGVATAAAATETAAIATTTAASVAATATTTTAQVAAATTTAAAWTPAAFMASIGSFGAAAVIGIGAVLALGALGGFRKGGYTGDGGVDDVAGVVHGKEYVFDAASTARIGVDNLEAIRSGRQPTDRTAGRLAAPSAPAASGGLNLVVNNNARGVDVIARETTDGNGDPQYILDIVSRDMVNGGQTADAVASITGTQYQGS